MSDLSDVTWRKSSRSAEEGQCVEVARTPGAIGIRDSKNPRAGHLTTNPAQWSAFLDGVKSGRYDL